MSHTDQIALVNAQNTTLQNIIDQNKELLSTDNQKSIYQLADSANLDIINKALIFAYFALLIVVAYILVFVMQKNIYIKAAIMALFIIYPFVINWLVLTILSYMGYMNAIINGNVYVWSNY
jgi:hypothetical protein